MMESTDISERNGKLVKLISSLDLGLHIVNLTHKPSFITYDWKYKLNMWVKNFTLILMQNDTDKYFEFNINDKHDSELLRAKIVEMMTMFEQKRVYVLVKGSFFLVGFNHHNKVDKQNPYPVFANYDPLVYENLEMAKNTAKKFDLQLLYNEDSDSIPNYNSY